MLHLQKFLLKALQETPRPQPSHRLGRNAGFYFSLRHPPYFSGLMVRETKNASMARVL
jgi:hypothetical protein